MSINRGNLARIYFESFLKEKVSFVVLARYLPDVGLWFMGQKPKKPINTGGSGDIGKGTKFQISSGFDLSSGFIRGTFIFLLLPVLLREREREVIESSQKWKKTGTWCLCKTGLY